MNTMNLTAKRLALPAVSILALASVLLLAGWSSASAAPAHAAAKHAASSAQSATAIISQDVQASTTYHNPLDAVQTALANQNSLDPWARGTSVSRADFLAGLKPFAETSTLPNARLASQIYQLTLPIPAHVAGDVALNRTDPWQVLMASTLTNTALVLVEKVTRTGPQITLVHLIRTATLGWRVDGANPLTTDRRQAALGDSYTNPQLQALLSAEYVR